MNIRRHLLIGAGVITAILLALWWCTGSFELAAFAVVTILAQVIALDAFLFIKHYMKVQWNQSPWGRHVMRLCFILGVTFEAVVIVNILIAFHHYRVRPVAILTLIMYSAIAAEIHNRRYLEKRAQEEKMKRKAQNNG